MDATKLNADDLFFKKATKEEKKKIDNPDLVPAEYITVKLSSLGKLGVPSVLHVRDYNFEEALALSDITEENETEVIIQILNSIIFEDIDAGDLHKNDVIEILMTIQGTWYSPRLEDMPYYIDLNAKNLDDTKNIGTANLAFNSLKTTPLKSEVIMPITVKYRNVEVKFSLPKIKNEVIASKYIEKKYIEQENSLFEVKQKIQKKTATTAEIKEYQAYLKARSNDFIRVNQALLIENYRGIELTTLESKLDVLPNLSLSLLKKYTSLLSDKLAFGLNPEVEFFSEDLNKTITRRFDFRALHFLSSMEQSSDAGFDISFG